MTLLLLLVVLPVAVVSRGAQGPPVCRAPLLRGGVVRLSLRHSAACSSNATSSPLVAACRPCHTVVQSVPCVSLCGSTWWWWWCVSVWRGCTDCLLFLRVPCSSPRSPTTTWWTPQLQPRRSWAPTTGVQAGRPPGTSSRAAPCGPLRATHSQ